MSYRDRLLSVQLHPSATPTKTKRNYFDASAVHEAFGEDARDRLLDETGGRGAPEHGPDGRRYVRDPKTKERRLLDGGDIEFFTGAQSSQEL